MCRAVELSAQIERATVLSRIEQELGNELQRRHAMSGPAAKRLAARHQAEADRFRKQAKRLKRELNALQR